VYIHTSLHAARKYKALCSFMSKCLQGGSKRWRLARFQEYNQQMKLTAERERRLCELTNTLMVNSLPFSKHIKELSAQLKYL